MSDSRAVAADVMRLTGNVFAWCAVRCYRAARALRPELFETAGKTS